MAKVLIVATIAGTIRAFLLPFVEHFRARGWRVDGMASEIENCEVCRDKFDRVWEINWSRRPLAPRNLLSAPLQVRKIVVQEGYDLVHVHTPVAAFVTRFALRTISPDRRPRLVYTAHGFHFHSGGRPVPNSIFLALEKLAGRWTDYLVVMNQEDYRAAHHHAIVPPSRICFMPGIGVDGGALVDAVASAADGGAAIRRELGLEDRARLLLMVAEFIPRKCHADAVHALAGLNRPDVHLLCAGEGPMRDEIAALGHTLGVHGQLHLLGFRRDIPALMSAADAVLLPSRHEGLPRSLMEAMCLGTPCIGSDIRGTRDLLADGCGLLCPPGDREALTAAMHKVLEISAEAAEMARRAQGKMIDYDVSGIIARHQDLYEQALAG